MWKLNLDTFEWAQIGTKGGPSARSGHRMAVYKHNILMFGGFYDTGECSVSGAMLLSGLCHTGKWAVRWC